MYTGPYVALSLTSAPTYSGYSLAVFNMGQSMSVQLPVGAGTVAYQVLNEPVSFLFDLATSWTMIPGLYPNNSLAPVPVPP